MMVNMISPTEQTVQMAEDQLKRDKIANKRKKSVLNKHSSKRRRTNRSKQKQSSGKIVKNKSKTSSKAKKGKGIKNILNLNQPKQGEQKLNIKGLE